MGLRSASITSFTNKTLLNVMSVAAAEPLPLRLHKKSAWPGHVFGIDIPASRLDRARQIATQGLGGRPLDRDGAPLVNSRLYRLGLNKG
jgi:hypothetical protein